MKKKITVLGGGTGLSYLLKGLKNFPIDITAVITVSDNGRSTGFLRKEFNTPAVGDIRKVITALSETDEEIKNMMEYRFKSDSDLGGHAVGNLMLTSLLDITGSLKDSIKALGTLFDVKHKVLPISEDSDLTLMGESIDGVIIEGEEQITKAHTKFKKIYYKEEPKVLNEVIESIEDSDLIIFSMGSLYTSILPNIICHEVSEALTKTKAPIMYLCNAMTQPGETDKYTTSDHIKLLNNYLINRKVDLVIASNTNIDKKVLKKYETEEQKDIVKIDKEEIKKLDCKLIESDLIIVEDNMLRHDSMKLGSLITSYLLED